MFRKSALAIAAASLAATAPLIFPPSAVNAATASSRDTASRTEVNAAPEDTFALKSKNANECLDGNAGDKLHSCNRSDVQKWRFADAGQGKVYIVWAPTGECVRSNGETQTVSLIDCRHGIAFTAERTQQGYYKFKHDLDGMCLGSFYGTGGDWGLSGWRTIMDKCTRGDRHVWVKQ